MVIIHPCAVVTAYTTQLANKVDELTVHEGSAIVEHDLTEDSVISPCGKRHMPVRQFTLALVLPYFMSDIHP